MTYAPKRQQLDSPPNGDAGTFLAVALLLFVLVSAAPAIASTRVDLFPKVQPGQNLTYVITYRSDTQTKTRSPVALAASPGQTALNVRALLFLDILDLTTPPGKSRPGSRPSIHASAKLQSLDANSSDSAAGTAANLTPVDFTILPDGRLDKITGLDALTPGLQHAWQQWAARFAASAAYPLGGIKSAQNWKSQEPERTPSPLAGLIWFRESTYVRNEPCRPLRMNDQGDFVNSDQPPQTCAVILVTAALKQQSKPKDATPEEYGVRQLRTSGAARGHNKTILYLSLATGLLVRSSDEADQSMSVTIAKADGSNQLHYDIDAKSAAQVVLVTSTSPSGKHP
jgi:hypothetical protein